MASADGNANDGARDRDATARDGHVAYFAGGCVRDLVRGETPKDIDIATDARPEAVQKIFPADVRGGRAFRRDCGAGGRISI